MNIPKTPKNIFFFGTQGLYSATVLEALLDQGISISQIFCSGAAPASAPISSLPVSQPIKGGALVDLADKSGIKIQYLNKRTDITALNIQQYGQPDFILVACFPFILPESIINWPTSGCLNIHPSLLPKYRGPDPLFWQLHNDEPNTGVSLHFVNSQFDAGPIVSQKSYLLKDGAKWQENESRLAKAGANLFTAFLATNQPLGYMCHKQDESKAGYNPYPTFNDYEIPVNWSARQAFNFIHGTCSPNAYYVVNTNTGTLKISDALEYYENGDLIDHKQKTKDELFIQFSPGILRAKSY